MSLEEAIKENTAAVRELTAALNAQGNTGNAAADTGKTSNKEEKAARQAKTEQAAQDALLGGGEQCPGQAGGGVTRRSLADLPGTEGVVHAHIGHDNAQIGQVQAQVMSACESACIS